MLVPEIVRRSEQPTSSSVAAASKYASSGSLSMLKRQSPSHHHRTTNKIKSGRRINPPPFNAIEIPEKDGVYMRKGHSYSSILSSKSISNIEQHDCGALDDIQWRFVAKPMPDFKKGRPSSTMSSSYVASSKNKSTILQSRSLNNSWVTYELTGFSPDRPFYPNGPLPCYENDKRIDRIRKARTLYNDRTARRLSRSMEHVPINEREAMINHTTYNSHQGRNSYVSQFELKKTNNRKVAKKKVDPTPPQTRDTTLTKDSDYNMKNKTKPSVRNMRFKGNSQDSNSYAQQFSLDSLVSPGNKNVVKKQHNHVSNWLDDKDFNKTRNNNNKNNMSVDSLGQPPLSSLSMYEETDINSNHNSPLSMNSKKSATTRYVTHLSHSHLYNHDLRTAYPYQEPSKDYNALLESHGYEGHIELSPMNAMGKSKFDAIRNKFESGRISNSPPSIPYQTKTINGSRSTLI